MADGELIFDTEIDTENFEKGVKDIKNKLNNINNSVDSISRSTKKAFDGMSSAQIGLVNSLDQTKKKMKELKTKITEIEETKVPTDKYTKLQDKLRQLKNDYKALTAEQRKQKSYTGYNANSDEAKALDAQIKQTRAELNAKTIALSNLKVSGGAFKAQGITAESSDLRGKLNTEEGKFLKLNKQLDELNAKQNKASSTGLKLKNMLAGIGRTAQSLGSRISKAFKNSENPAKLFIRKLTSIGTMLKARVIRGLISGIVNGVKTGFNNLVQYSSTVNNSISGLKSSFTQLSNTLATAFMPVLQQITPIIQNVIDKVIEAMNVVAQFTSRLFSNSTTFTRAKKVNEDYAKSLGKTSQTEKKAFSFDTIEKIDSKKDGSVSPNDMFEEANIEKGVLGFTDVVKNAISNGDWRGVGTLLAGKLNGIFDSVNFGAIGAKVGTKITNALHVVHGFLSNFDFRVVGSTLAEGINGLSNSIDWGLLASDISLGISGVFGTCSSFLQTLDWQGIGRNVYEFLTNVDWGGIFRSVFEFIGSLIGSAFALLYGFIESAMQDIMSWWNTKMTESGGNVGKAWLRGLLETIYNIGAWLWDNIAKPLIDGFLKVFGIENGCPTMAEMGKALADGLFNGIKNAWNGLVDGVKNLCSNFVNGVKTFFRNSFSFNCIC